MLIVSQYHLTITQCCLVADCALNKSRCAAWEVIDYLWLAFFDVVDIDNIDIGTFADCEDATIVQAKHFCRHSGHTSHGFLDGVKPDISMPVR